MKIDGQNIAKKIIGNLKLQPVPQKFLAAILIGENPASLNFLKQKEKVAIELGIDFRVYKFPENSTNDFLRKEIGKTALLKKAGGVIIQLPLPENLNRHYILNVIPRGKDIDVLGERALGAFYVGRNQVLPPAVGVVEEILAISHWPLAASKVAVVGLGFLVGRPLAVWLMGKVSELYLLDQDSDLSLLKQADLVISGVGKSGLIKPEMLKKGAGIIDFGYSIDESGKISGDFDSNSLMANGQLLNFYTPTPGGAGPILVAKLFENFYTLAGV
jgi:methylenetetrahydrofolate dehydrogenase (NADP+)/methenyltetrahydrofolate cyclohydrolase